MGNIISRSKLILVWSESQIIHLYVEWKATIVKMVFVIALSLCRWCIQMHIFYNHCILILISLRFVPLWFRWWLDTIQVTSYFWIKTQQAIHCHVTSVGHIVLNHLHATLLCDDIMAMKLDIASDMTYISLFQIANTLSPVPRSCH